MNKSKIDWTDRTWNPIRGCSKVSEGCKNCYAELMAMRFCGPGEPYHGVITNGRWNGEINRIYDKLEDPLRWTKPSMVFVNSMSDLFHENVPDDFIKEVFVIMARSPLQTFQVLTKRSSRMEQWFGSWAGHEAAREAAELEVEWPLPNVWLGVSVETQDWAGDRIPGLLNVPAAVRFVSAEPLLEDLDLMLVEDPTEGGYFNALEQGIDWVIVGCESGAALKRREMEEWWVRDLRRQCISTETAFFYKQAIDSEGDKIKMPLLDGVRWNEYPT